MLFRDQAGTSAGSEEQDGECGEEIAPVENIHTTLQNFWTKVNDDMKKINGVSLFISFWLLIIIIIS